MAVSIVRRGNDADKRIVDTSQQIAESADSIHAAIRHMLVSLRPTSLDQFGLADAVGDLVSDWRIKHPGKRFTLNCGNLPEDVSPELSTATYRIIQEALTNAVRHSGASEINVKLTASSDLLDVNIEDNGNGLKPQLTHGFGISGMKERAAALQGTLSVNTGSNGGCHVSLQLPLTTAA